jgi:hypothetical protein
MLVGEAEAPRTEEVLRREELATATIDDEATGTSTDEAITEDSAVEEDPTSTPATEEATCTLELVVAVETTAATLETLAAADVEVALTTELALVDEEAEAEPEAAKLAHAKLIFVTGAPLLLGALKSHVISTYGQQTLSVPTFAISPETNAADETTGFPTLLPALSTIWNEVPL